MIDIHSHVLWDVDDGAEDIAESIEMARIWAADGIRTVFATSHVPRPILSLPGRSAAERCNELNQRLELYGIPVTFVPGAEIYLTPDVAGLLLARREGVRPLGDSHYLLVENWLQGTREGEIERILQGLIAAGWRPILAHPERYVPLQKDPERLARIVAMGVHMQVTAGSLFGDFGRAATLLAHQIIEAELATVIATDAHNCTGRRPGLSAARDRIAQLWGPAMARRLTVDNPTAILNDEPLKLVGDGAALRSPPNALLGVTQS